MNNRRWRIYTYERVNRTSGGARAQGGWGDVILDVGRYLSRAAGSDARERKRKGRGGAKSIKETFSARHLDFRCRPPPYRFTAYRLSTCRRVVLSLSLSLTLLAVSVFRKVRALSVNRFLGAGGKIFSRALKNLARHTVTSALRPSSSQSWRANSWGFMHLSLVKQSAELELME